MLLRAWFRYHSVVISASVSLMLAACGDDGQGDGNGGDGNGGEGGGDGTTTGGTSSGGVTSGGTNGFGGSTGPDASDPNGQDAAAPDGSDAGPLDGSVGDDRDAEARDAGMPTTPPACSELTPEECTEDLLCGVLQAQRVLADGTCSDDFEDVGCIASDAACAAVITYASSPSGQCWMFTSGCIPPDWDASDDACQLEAGVPPMCF